VEDEIKPTPVAKPESTAASPARFAPRSWQRRGNWIMLGRVLGGFGAFIAAIIAAAQFAFTDGGGAPTGETATVSQAPGPYSYVERRDDSATIRVEVPTAWGNVDGGPWTSTGIRGFADGTPLGAKLAASPNVTAWRAAGELTTPGVLVGVSDVLPSQWAVRSLAQAFNYEGCQYTRDDPYAGGGLTGWQVRSDCPGSATRWVTLAATSPAVPGALVFVQAKLVTEDDQEAYERVLGTLSVGRE
jgi:hypothetical protein